MTELRRRLICFCMSVAKADVDGGPTVEIFDLALLSPQALGVCLSLSHPQPGQ